jgi:hypothetical protein
MKRKAAAINNINTIEERTFLDKRRADRIKLNKT